MLMSVKLNDILKMVDTVLSSTPLPPPILSQCKVFLLITASPAPSKRLKPGFNTERTPKERIVGVVVSQGIKWAMRVIKPEETKSEVVDSGDGVLCE